MRRRRKPRAFKEPCPRPSHSGRGSARGEGSRGPDGALTPALSQRELEWGRSHGLATRDAAAGGDRDADRLAGRVVEIAP